MKTIICLLSSTCLFLAGCQQNIKNENDFAVMAYYMPSDSSIEVNSLPLDKLTHIIFSFTHIVNNNMVFVNDEMNGVLEQLVEAKKTHPLLKVMVACGGWGGSGGFSDMAMTSESRSEFVKSVIAFIDQHKLDGLDIDWEYPGMPGIGNPYRPEDKENFTILMADLRFAMDELTPGLTLSFASAGWELFYRHIELEKVMNYVDYMNVMTYDFVGGQSPFTNHHTNLMGINLSQSENTPLQNFIDTSSVDYQPRSADEIIRYCIALGTDPKQIVIGGAFYGKAWKGVSPSNNGLFQNHSGFKGYHTYDELSQMAIGDTGYKRYWDDNAKAPFLYHARDSIFVSYDDTLSIKLKTQYAKDLDLGGVMFWQLRQDSKENDLVNTIYQEANQKN